MARVKVALQALTPAELAARAGIDVVDARRIVSLVHRHGRLPERSPANIRRRALDAARAIGAVPGLELVERRASSVDPFVKLSLRLPDGAVIETVRIPLEKEKRFSICVSSQVGCALGCTFCATGTMGLRRNLEAWEIVEQVRAARADLALHPPGAARPKVHGVLFQGMGEPLANLDEVVAAIRVLRDPSAQAIDVRNITVCTAGLVSGIRRLAEEVPGVRLAVSLGSAKPGARRSLMPIDRAHPLPSVMAAAGEHARRGGYSPMFAYTLLAGHNDGDDDAAHLAALVTDFTREYGIRPRLSLIPFNDFATAPFSRSPRIAEFRDALAAGGASSIVRYSGGGDVGAACGQLVAGAATGPSIATPGQ
jgi:23S rRNA (adenine2503-C2)-methyltransferase